MLTEVEDAPQLGISSETEIGSSGRRRGVRDNKLFPKPLNDDVSDVVFVDEPSSSSFKLGMLVDTERADEGVLRSSREAVPGRLIGGVDSARLNEIPLGGDVNLEKNFFFGEAGTGA